MRSTNYAKRYASAVGAALPSAWRFRVTAIIAIVWSYPNDLESGFEVIWLAPILAGLALAGLIFWAVRYDAKHGDGSEKGDWRTY